MISLCVQASGVKALLLCQLEIWYKHLAKFIELLQREVEAEKF